MDYSIKTPSDFQLNPLLILSLMLAMCGCAPMLSIQISFHLKEQWDESISPTSHDICILLYTFLFVN